MPRQSSPRELLERAQNAMSAMPAPPNPCRARKIARLRARMPRYVPSDRNRTIFEEVAIQHKSHEEVAFRHEVSRQRVAKIVQRMRDWIAFWGGDDAAYGPPERYRLATNLAASELIDFQRQIQEAIRIAGFAIESIKMRHDQNGNKLWCDRNYQKYPRPSALYKMLLTAILARIKLSGAGRDAGFDLGSGNTGNQSMVVRTEINVNQAASSPPKEALRSDNLSESTCVEGSSGAFAGTIQNQRS